MKYFSFHTASAFHCQSPHCKHNHFTVLLNHSDGISYVLHKDASPSEFCLYLEMNALGTSSAIEGFSSLVTHSKEWLILIQVTGCIHGLPLLNIKVSRRRTCCCCQSAPVCP